MLRILSLRTDSIRITSFVLHFVLCTIALCLEFWCNVVSIASEFHSDALEVFLDSGGIHTFGECVRQVVVCTNLVDYKHFLTHFVLGPKLGHLDVPNFTSTSSIADTYRGTRIGIKFDRCFEFDTLIAGDCLHPKALTASLD